MKDYMTQTVTIPIWQFMAFLRDMQERSDISLPHTETDAKQFIEGPGKHLPQEVIDAIVAYMRADQQDQWERSNLFNQIREPALKLPMQQRMQVFQAADAFVRYGTPETVKGLVDALKNLKMKGVEKIYTALKPWADNE